MKIVLYAFLMLVVSTAVAQRKDTLTAKGNAVMPVDTVKNTSADTVKKITPHNPRLATKRSALLPGWGQAYNKKYWKIPIVWGALGTCVGFFVYNRSEYIASRDAYRNMRDGDPTNNYLIKPKFQPVDPEAVRQYRNGVRQNIDYSVLFFMVCWGLNVVDATVDGHLKEFNVTENLTMRINPTFVPQTKQTGISMVMRLGK
ncbi:MAG TPA: DUF5683 domain-containing protein [Lacibacter sp.]|nr:DUF5683 domain-containing protein [Lacibacter sp.]